MSGAELFGFRIHGGTLEEVVALVMERIERGDRVFHASLNAAKVAMCHRSADFRRTMQAFDIVTPDGMSIVLAARLSRARVRERIAGIDLMCRILSEAEARGLSVYLLGARPEVLGRAAVAMRGRHPGLRIAGTHDGYFDPIDERRLVREINATEADLLFVGMSSPRKEEFLVSNREALTVGFAMGVGGAFDVWAGDVRRAPRWVQSAGLEWLYRVVHEPRRLGAKYARDSALFTALLAREILGGGPEGGRR